MFHSPDGCTAGLCAGRQARAKIRVRACTAVTTATTELQCQRGEDDGRLCQAVPAFGCAMAVAVVFVHHISVSFIFWMHSNHVTPGFVPHELPANAKRMRSGINKGAANWVSC